MKKENIVLFDLIPTQPSSDSKFHGGGDYTSYIFQEALRRGVRNIEVVYNRNRHIDEEIIRKCNKYGIVKHEVETFAEIGAILSAKKYKCFYSALPESEYQNFDYSFTEFIFTIHGARKLELTTDRFEYKYIKNSKSFIFYIFNNLLNGFLFYKKDYNNLSRFFKIKNRKIITVSQHSKFSLLSLYPELKNDEINVFYSPMEFPEIGIYAEQSDYFLIISANRWLKNSYRAIKAFDSLFSKGLLKGKKVVVLGAENINNITKVENKNRFEFYGYVSKNELNEYLKQAFCFVYPTLNEGFGYPPVQAMSYGTPVIASAISSIPEVCGNAVLYFNPYSIKEIENRILQLTNDSDLYQTLQKRGLSRCNEILDIQKKSTHELLNIIFESNR